MLSDPLQWINSFGHSKLSPYLQPGAGIGLVIDIRNHYAIQSHLVTSLDDYFFMMSVTPPDSPGATCGVAAGGGACPLARRTLPMTGDGATRFVW
jgi:hypothetical protein